MRNEIFEASEILEALRKEIAETKEYYKTIKPSIYNKLDSQEKRIVYVKDLLTGSANYLNVQEVIISDLQNDINKLEVICMLHGIIGAETLILESYEYLRNKLIEAVNLNQRWTPFFHVKQKPRYNMRYNAEGRKVLSIYRENLAA